MEKFLRSGAWFECGSSVVEADISSEVFRDFSVKNSAAVWTVVNKSCTIPEEYPRSCLRRRRRSMNEDGFASERGWEKYVRFRFEGVFWYLESIIPSESAHRLPLSETFESLDFETRKVSIEPKKEQLEYRAYPMRWRFWRCALIDSTLGSVSIVFS